MWHRRSSRTARTTHCSLWNESQRCAHDDDLSVLERRTITRPSGSWRLEPAWAPIPGHTVASQISRSLRQGHLSQQPWHSTQQNSARARCERLVCPVLSSECSHTVRSSAFRTGTHRVNGYSASSQQLPSRSLRQSHSQMPTQLGRWEGDATVQLDHPGREDQRSDRSANAVRTSGQGRMPYSVQGIRISALLPRLLGCHAATRFRARVQRGT